jgi:hypothetical protein
LPFSDLSFPLFAFLLGHVPTREGTGSTEIVENPVEKTAQTHLRSDQLEQFSGLHHRGAIVNRLNTGSKTDGLYCKQRP